MAADDRMGVGSNYIFRFNFGGVFAGAQENADRFKQGLGMGSNPIFALRYIIPRERVVRSEPPKHIALTA